METMYTFDDARFLDRCTFLVDLAGTRVVANPADVRASADRWMRRRERGETDTAVMVTDGEITSRATPGMAAAFEVLGDAARVVGYDDEGLAEIAHPSHEATRPETWASRRVWRRA